MLQANRRTAGKGAGDRGRALSDWARAAVYVVRGEIAFLFFTAVSVALHPGFVLKRNEGGMSNYGVHVETALPYTLALLSLALYSHRAALLYRDGDKRSKKLRVLLTCYSAVVVAVMVSTYVYTLSPTLKDVHFALGTALILVVGVGSLWLYRLWAPSPGVGVGVLLFIQLVGDVLSLLTVVGWLHLLFISEIAANVGFAALLILSCRRLAVEGERTTTLGGPTS
ncbi:MAG: hypothetical protein JWM55_54 [Acidimicrobiaceae bacterium]|nr:hypothetical protein [Acidimicrobiaceae bacterium]